MVRGFCAGSFGVRTQSSLHQAHRPSRLEYSRRCPSWISPPSPWSLSRTGSSAWLPQLGLNGVASCFYLTFTLQSYCFLVCFHSLLPLHRLQIPSETVQVIIHLRLWILRLRTHCFLALNPNSPRRPTATRTLHLRYHHSFLLWIGGRHSTCRTSGWCPRPWRSNCSERTCWLALVAVASPSQGLLSFGRHSSRSEVVTCQSLVTRPWKPRQHCLIALDEFQINSASSLTLFGTV